ncbi:TetR/AcrR family transcriptional regulator [Abyssisolibacter fermentans]|uniref:TetR/AcrR family transcriptional regulator n=1 Tax=Abyssisolibacter fermentans TaxID=1766203 RepID=UPI00082C8AD4|nr:TetR/AcrR family transcriptional regulator [Abyssisolibacter fermentans]
MGRERQKQKKEETRQLILDTARSIVVKEGIDKLSIRKITNILDYSPGIIYHYFKDKDEIVDTLLKEGYGKILKSLSTLKVDNNDPEKEIKEDFMHYIYTVLKFQDEYKAFLLCERPSILKYTCLLHKGVSNDRKSIQKLCASIKKGIKQGVFADCDVELTAQSLWVSVFGLVLRLIIEKTTDEQRCRLINRQLEVLINGIKR